MLDRYKRATHKDAEKLLYVVMGLNHLREWIAPLYDPKTMNPSTPQEIFYEGIFGYSGFKILKSICELSKHQNARSSITTAVGYSELPQCDWRSFAEVKKLRDGYPSHHFINQNDAADVCLEVLKYYKDNWFLPNQLHVLELPDISAWPSIALTTCVPDTSGLFGINSPREMLGQIKIALHEYKRFPAKDAELVLFVLMGLNHLCEWIAPVMLRKSAPNDPRSKFYKDIHAIRDFLEVKDLCNRSKHLSSAKPTSVEYSGEVSFDDVHGLFDPYGDFDAGPPTQYNVDGADVVLLCERVLLYYDSWFAANPQFA